VTHRASANRAAAEATNRENRSKREIARGSGEKGATGRLTTGVAGAVIDKD